MKIIDTAVPGVLIFQPTMHADDRGFFMETFRSSHFATRGLGLDFVQDNQSRSKKGTLRGLHFQRERPQGKLVRVLYGEVFDVAVDIRKGSSTFGKWVGEYLSSDNNRQLWVPPGFAHGFYVISPVADLVYKCTDYYQKDDEISVSWSDPALAIEWPLNGQVPLLSERDSNAPLLHEVTKFP